MAAYLCGRIGFGSTFGDIVVRVGNRSKRGRRDPESTDPVAEWQEEARWSGYTRQNRWPFVAGNRPGPGPMRGRLPGIRAWLGIAMVVLTVLGAVWLVFWLLGIVLP